jgi:hypothetical protein
MRTATLALFLVTLSTLSTGGKSDDSSIPPSPLQVVGSVKSSAVLTWVQIHDGNGSVAVFNSSPKSITVKPDLQQVREALEETSLVHPLPISLTENITTIQPNELHRFVIKPDLPKSPIPGTYAVTFILQDVSAQTEPLQQQIKITVASLPPLFSKTNVTLWRLVPLWSASCWRQRRITVPLARSYETFTSCTRFQSALISDSGRSVTANYQCSATQARELVFDSPHAAGKYVGDVTLAQYPDKVTEQFTIIAKDIVLYPMLVIALGTYLAFLAKRYVGVLRIIWGLQEEQAKLQLASKSSEEKYEEIAREQPFSNCSIKDDVDRQLNEISQFARKLKDRGTTTISPSDPDYVKALVDVQSLRDVTRAWPRLAETFRSLTEAARTVRELFAQSNAMNTQDDPQVVHLAFSLMTQGSLPTSKVASLTDQASSLQQLLKDWSEAFQRNLALRTIYDKIPKDGNYSDAQKAILSNLASEFAALPVQLWGVSSPSDLLQLTGFGGTFNTIAAQLAQFPAEPTPEEALRSSFQMLAAAPSPSSVFNPFFWASVWRPLELRPEADPARRITQLRFAMRRSDLAATVFAGFIGLLTGLNTFYIDKPFGSLQDYVSLFLWAAGTKAVLDLLLAVLDKFIPPVST